MATASHGTEYGGGNYVGTTPIPTPGHVAVVVHQLIRRLERRSLERREPLDWSTLKVSMSRDLVGVPSPVGWAIEPGTIVAEVTVQAAS